MELETYNLKNTFYNDFSLEKKLCHNTIQLEWKTLPTFFDNIRKLQENKSKNGTISFPLLDSDFYNFLRENRPIIEKIIEKVLSETKPFDFTYFGLQTIQSKYLLA